MRKRNWIAFGILLSIGILTLVGWSSWNNQLYDYENTTLSELAEGLSFQAKTPVKVPFKEMELTNRKLDRHKDELVVTLANVPNMQNIIVKISKEAPEWTSKAEKTDVEIGDGLKGQFIPEYEGKRSIIWQENDVHYLITYYYKFTAKELSKKQLIKMAEAFE